MSKSLGLRHDDRARRVLGVALFVAGLDVMALGVGVVLQTVASEPTNVLLGVTFGIYVATPLLFVAGLIAVWRS
jgi:hypothetical protein